MKSDGIEKTLKKIVSCAERSGALNTKDIDKVNIDTTVQQIAIAFPNDVRLYEKAREALVRKGS